MCFSPAAMPLEASRGTHGRKRGPPLLISGLVRKSNFFPFFGRGRGGTFSFGRVLVPSPKININLSEPTRSFTVKENHIGQVVNEILSFRQTLTERHLVI